MKKRALGFVAVAAVCVLPSCGTTNGIRWAYGEPSVYDNAAQSSDRSAARAIFGVPVIAGGVVFGAATLPIQRCGVWPLWGDSSMMKPKGE